jgi:hypothetical protein
VCCILLLKCSSTISLRKLTRYCHLGVFRSFVSFEDARAIVSAYEIPNQRAYRKWPDRPVNLPAKPEIEYKPHWKTWDYFLGKEATNKSQTKKLTPAERQRISRENKKRKSKEQGGPPNIQPSHNHEGHPSLPDPLLPASHSSSPASTTLPTPNGVAPNLSDAPSRNDVASTVSECVEPDPPQPDETLDTTQPGPGSPTEVANTSHSAFRDVHWDGETPLEYNLRGSRSRRSHQDQEPAKLASDVTQRTIQRKVVSMHEYVTQLSKGDKEQALLVLEKTKVCVRFCIPEGFSTLTLYTGLARDTNINCFCVATCRVREHKSTLSLGVSLFRALNSNPNRHLICPNHIPVAFSTLTPVLIVLARDRAAQPAATVFVLLLARCENITKLFNQVFHCFKH